MASLCTKCQQRATVYDVGGSKCDYCFQQAIIHNLKMTVSRKGLARFGDSVGLAASGGYASQALIDLLGRSLSEREDGKTTRMKLQVTVFHVDCETPLLQSSEKSRKVIEQLAAKYSFRVCYASEYMSSHQSLKETWERLAWNDVSDISDLEELSRIAVYRMIAILASSHGCKIVFDGLNANSICRNILTNISSGNGFAIPFEVSPIDISGRFSQVSIHHPQRDITDRQLMRYIWIRKIDFVAPNLLLQPVSSVESLTVSFLKELEVEHRSTIPNILRTSSKMELPLQFSYCSFCRVPVGSNGTLLSTCPDIRLCKACQYRQERMSSNAFQLFLSSFMAMDQLSQ
jgi:tRNA(Ile)-lysidine synthase TilS/MesJ